MKSKISKSVAIIVAHPDDETLWAGGTILNHPSWNCFIVCLCRKNDKERSIKFYKALKALNAQGIMGDIDDGAEQIPLDENELKQTILKLLPTSNFDIVITHNPTGEYTRHLRHEEVSKAVIELWFENKISTKKLKLFAYDDGGKKYYPKATENASDCQKLSENIWLRKYNIIADIYGFSIGSFEEATTPHTEAFWDFTDSALAKKWLTNGGVLHKLIN